MAKLDTRASAAVTTQAEASGEAEIKVGHTPPPSEIPTGVCHEAGSVPSGLPEMVEAEGYGYVFRVGGNSRSGRVTITLDTEQLVEQARVRKVNRAIRRAHRR